MPSIYEARFARRYGLAENRSTCSDRDGGADLVAW